MPNLLFWIIAIYPLSTGIALTQHYICEFFFFFFFMNLHYQISYSVFTPFHVVAMRGNFKDSFNIAILQYIISSISVLRFYETSVSYNVTINHCLILNGLTEALFTSIDVFCMNSRWIIAFQSHQIRSGSYRSLKTYLTSSTTQIFIIEKHWKPHFTTLERRNYRDLLNKIW